MLYYIKFVRVTSLLYETILYGTCLEFTTKVGENQTGLSGGSFPN